MYKGRHVKKTQISFGSILYWTVGTLLILTMFTTWLTSGLFAKYVISDNIGDSAHVAGAGDVKIELWEHKAKETYDDSGVYELLDGEKNLVRKNKYEKVLPGVDIPKDPFVRLEIKNTEVNYHLYVKVTESAPFPDNVTYEIMKHWKKVDSENGADTYVYVDEITQEPIVFEAGTDYPMSEIKILKGDTLYVGEHYVGNGTPFTLTFEAWIRQVSAS